MFLHLEILLADFTKHKITKSQNHTQPRTSTGCSASTQLEEQLTTFTNIQELDGEGRVKIQTHDARSAKV